METTVSVRVRRVESPAEPAVFVATRLIGLLGRTRQVALDRAEDDVVVLRVGPEDGRRPDPRWTRQLLEEMDRMLQDRVFDGWTFDGREPEIA